MTPDAFPGVVSFLRGYLHEDWALEYPSPAAARDAYLEDCTPDERREFHREAGRLADLLAAAPLPDAKRLLTEVLGAAWHPATREDIESLFPPTARQ